MLFSWTCRGCVAHHIAKRYFERVKSIIEFLDYREYLKYFYEAKKREKHFFSYKLMGNKVGMDPSYLCKVMSKSFHIADSSIQEFVRLCAFDARESEYFDALVHFSKSRTPQESKAFFDRLMDLRGVTNRLLIDHQFRYYQNWYTPVLRSALSLIEFRDDFAELAGILDPSITVAQAKEAFETLVALELVQKRADGVWEIIDTHVSTGGEYRSMTVRFFQKEMLHLAERAMEETPREERDISTLTMAIRRSSIPDIRELLRTCREDIQKRVAQDEDVDCVYQLNLQYFPVASGYVDSDNNDA